MSINYVKRMFITLLFLVISGCTSIPPEAPELSIELGKRISAIEKANITLLQRFFDQKRLDVDQFIEDEWVPVFAKEFFSNPKIAKAWRTLVRENNKKQRLIFLVKVGPKLQTKINAKRLELIQPLDELQRRMEDRLREEYLQARSINNSITSFLLSAAKVAESRNRYMEKAGMSQDKMGSLIDKTDDTVNKLLKGAKTAQGKLDSSDEYLEKMREIRDSI